MTTEPSTQQCARILAVHAHPDDESIATGLLLASLNRLGAEVINLTCTLGEQGEVIGEKYADLIADKTDQLGGYRISELQRALGQLGLEPRPMMLGGAATWRDSGMDGTPSIKHPQAFAGTSEESFDREVSQLKTLITELKPQIVVTYGPDGGYGHPDHIRAHDMTHRAVDELATERSGWCPQEIWWAVTPKQSYLAAMAGVSAPEGWRLPKAEEIALVDETNIDVLLRGDAADIAAKTDAMREHATQIWLADGKGSDVNPETRQGSGADGETLYALSNLIAQPILPVEGYQLGWRRTEKNAADTEQFSLLDFDSVVHVLREPTPRKNRQE